MQHALVERPLASATALVARTGLFVPAVNRALMALEELEVVREVTGRRRNRLFSYAPYLHILSEGMEPL